MSHQGHGPCSALQGAVSWAVWDACWPRQLDPAPLRDIASAVGQYRLPHQLKGGLRVLYHKHTTKPVQSQLAPLLFVPLVYIISFQYTAQHCTAKHQGALPGR